MHILDSGYQDAVSCLQAGLTGYILARKAAINCWQPLSNVKILHNYQQHLARSSVHMFVKLFHFTLFSVKPGVMFNQ